jgi:sugar phosphate isomerase/epimerase
MQPAKKQTRREMMVATASAVAGAAVGPAVQMSAHAESPAPASPGAIARASYEIFGYCLNTSTIRGTNLTIVEAAEIAAKTGYQAIEPWISEIADYQKKGGTLADLGKRIRDLGLSVEDAIGFDEWIVDDDDRRAKGMEAMKLHMDWLSQIGGKRIAAPSIGAHRATDPKLDLHKVAERYRALLDLGDKMGVQPLIELWGSSRNLNRLADVAFVALEANHPRASMLLDLYHLHKGGSDFLGLRLINGAALHIIHTNDYPDLPIDQLTDAQRVFPGDGVAPFGDILRTLMNNGFRGFLSLELFNRDYWKQSPLKVAQTGIDKMRGVVKKALG